MKGFLPAVAAMVLGFGIGGWQSRGDLLAARARVAELEEAAKAPCREGPGARIREWLGAPPAPAAPRPAAPAVPDPGDEAAARQDRAAEGDAEGGEPVDGPAGEGAGPGGAGPRSLEEVEKLADDALRVRRAQARAALAEQAKLDEEALAEVDEAMDEMNHELAAVLESFVDDVEDRGDLDRRTAMELGAAALDVVLAADDRMRQIVPDDAREDLDDSVVDPLSYLSGEVVAPLSRLDRIEGPWQEGL